MKIEFKNKLILLMAILMLVPTMAMAEDTSNRKERNFIRKGNAAYEKGRYPEAEVEYNKALGANPGSDIATYNLALSYLNQSSASDKADDENSPINKATKLLKNLATTTSDKNLASKAYYNLGNIAFNNEQYDQSIDMYKNCLRRNPNDNDAIDNLRLAQKKKKEQEQEQQNQQQNQQDKQQQQQEEQEQQDQKDQQNQQNQQNNQDQQQQQNTQNNQQQHQQGMSQENIDQILKAMQNAEQNTQERVNEERAKGEKARTRSEKNW